MSEPEGAERPRSRRWFVAVAWVTLVLFGIFVAVITLCAARVPRLQSGGLDRPAAECRLPERGR
jgi:hypothetical protein